MTVLLPELDPRPLGLLQPLADGIKFLLKEDFTPAHVRKGYYWLAPALTMDAEDIAFLTTAIAEVLRERA